ncbi:MAG: hypothetical protein WBA17_04450 [Saprospiraceae bacterium]
MKLSEKLDGLELKLRQLAGKLARMDREADEMARENNRLKTELDRQNGVVSSLKDKLARVQRDSAEPNGEDTREQIDHYLREIDRCIEWLRQN